MLSPTYTKDLHILLHRLWAALTAAGNNFTDQYAVMPGGEEFENRIALQIGTRLPKGAKPHITAFIKQFTHDSGWLVDGFRYYNNRVEFNCSPAVRHPTARRTSP
jgi:hypothetical protein